MGFRASQTVFIVRTGRRIIGETVPRGKVSYREKFNEEEVDRKKFKARGDTREEARRALGKLIDIECGGRNRCVRLGEVETSIEKLNWAQRTLLSICDFFDTVLHPTPSP